jgi:hypothetical protein
VLKAQNEALGKSDDGARLKDEPCTAHESAAQGKGLVNDEDISVL